MSKEAYQAVGSTKIRLAVVSNAFSHSLGRKRALGIHRDHLKNHPNQTVNRVRSLGHLKA
jgi:hypothetical protein